MKLSPQGTTLAWFAVAMTVVGAIFQNALLVAVAMLAIAFLALQAIHFRGQVNTLRKKLTVKVEPETSTTLVDAFFKFEAYLSNSSPVLAEVTGFALTLPVEIQATIRNARQKQILAQKSFLAYNCRAQALSPGLFRASSASVSLEDRSTLLTDILRIRCNVVVEVTPKLTEPALKIETSDPRRLGAGTEVAGVKEAATEEDFRVIDWKTTARTGKYIAKDFLRELTPPAIIVVDRSTLTQSRRSPVRILHEVARLLVSFGPSTRVGLTIFDDRSIISHFEPSVGQRSTQQMINALIVASGEDAKSVPSEIVTRSYLEVMNTVRILKASKTNPVRRTIDVFTRSLLPYYENALSNYPSKLRKQGSYQALMRISKLQQPAFVIIIIDLEKDLSGICEGTVTLNQTGHRVVLSVISNPRESLPTELLSLRQLGIMLLQSGDTSGLLADIREEIRAAPRIRTRSVNQR